MGLQGSNDFDDCREDLVEGGKCAAPKSAMPQIEKERNWAKANQLPAGPREKRPKGRLFSSKYYYDNLVCLGRKGSSFKCP